MFTARWNGGPTQASDVEMPAESAYDVVAEDFVDLAEHLEGEPVI